MDSVELALKNSNIEKALTGGVQNGDDFSVDDLFDFSNNDDVVFVEDEADLKKQQKSRDDEDNTIRRSKDFSTDGEDIGSLPISELSVPMDDLAELEWLSNFVDDSLTPYSAPTKKPVWLTGNRRHPVAPVNEAACFKPPPPATIRPKRARTGVRVRSIGWSNESSSSSATSSSSSSSSPSSPQWFSGSEFLDESMVKKQHQKKKKPSDIWKNAGQTRTQTRRCNHCGVQKTPQWRAGPAGAKTLCNACGVRFKSGRLLPEYRPACSPTFSSELHSNHHRKVIEMRQKKETSDSDDAVQTVLNPPVQRSQIVPSF